MCMIIHLLCMYRGESSGARRSRGARAGRPRAWRGRPGARLDPGDSPGSGTQQRERERERQGERGRERKRQRERATHLPRSRGRGPVQQPRAAPRLRGHPVPAERLRMYKHNGRRQHSLKAEHGVVLHHSTIQKGIACHGVVHVTSQTHITYTWISRTERATGACRVALGRCLSSSAHGRFGKALGKGLHVKRRIPTRPGLPRFAYIAPSPKTPPDTARKIVEWLPWRKPLRQHPKAGVREPGFKKVTDL